MGPIRFVKTNWRLLLLVTFVAVALVALFIPGGIMADDSLVEDDQARDNPTNLEFGIELDGGTRVSAPPVGMYVDPLLTDASDQESVPDQDHQSEIQAALTEELDLDSGNVTVRQNDDGRVTAELFTDQVSEAEFTGVLADEGIDVDESDVENGVTAETREQMIQTIQTMINEAGLSGGTAYEEQTAGGDHFIVTEVPDMDPNELRELLSDRGVVEVWAYHPDGEDGHTNETVLTGDDIVTVDPPQSEGDGYQVPVEVAPGSAPDYQERMNDLEFTGDGQGRCQLSGDGETVSFDHDDDQWCLVTVVDGEPVDAHSMGPRLAQNMHDGTWANSPSFFMGAQTLEQAQSLSVSLQAGALPAPLDFSQEQTFSIQPALAEQFKLFSLLIGGLAILTVSGVVFLRYRNPRVAVPMIVTATAEVVILLGFVALVRMPMDLSHVAGFIAVVGTGVDDLLIIADEVMDDGEVNSRRVFESRFRKAFWIIGAAAATTIIALSPLAVLSLGDLRGFAIVTILGVLVGVFVTRPAYGEILQRLLTDR